MINPAEHEKLDSEQQLRCVLRSLESITGVKATADEEAYRRDQIIIQKNTFAPLFDKNITLDLLIKSLQAERDNVRTLVERIMDSESPVGLALKQYSMSEQDMYPKRVAELLAKGDQVILVTASHVAHLGQDVRQKSLVSLSDAHTRVPLEPHRVVHVMTFTLKR